MFDQLIKLFCWSKTQSECFDMLLHLCNCCEFVLPRRQRDKKWKSVIHYPMKGGSANYTEVIKLKNVRTRGAEMGRTQSSLFNDMFPLTKQKWCMKIIFVEFLLSLVGRRPLRISRKITSMFCWKCFWANNNKTY